MCKKMITSIVLTLAFLFCSVLQTSAAVNASKSMDLEAAINAALANSSSLKLYDDKIKLAESRLRTAQLFAKDAPNKYWSTDSQHIENKKQEILYPLQREADLNNLKWEKQDKERSIRLETNKLYFQILFKDEQIRAQGKEIIRVTNEYNWKKSQVEKGMASETSLLTYETAVDDAKAVLDTYTFEKESLLMDLNQKLGFRLDQEIILKVREVPRVDFSIADIDKLAADMVTAAHSVRKLESEKMLLEKEYEIIRNYSILKLPDSAEKMEDDILNYSYKIRDEKAAVESNIRSSYNNLLNTKDQITMKKLEYEKNVKLLKVAKKRNELGLSTHIELAKSQASADNSLIAWKKAQLDYYLAVEDFRSLISPISEQK